MELFMIDMEKGKNNLYKQSYMNVSYRLMNI